MEKFTIIKSKAVLINEQNIDTDQIIPARFLKAVNREGFGEKLFYDKRYKADGAKNKDFILNNSKQDSEILVAGRNFGCGSSREHAAWAIADYGFRVVVSSFFADIFKNNALNNGILTVQVSDDFLNVIKNELIKNSEQELNINLKNQSIKITTNTYKFEINEFKKQCLMLGMDNIDFVLSKKQEIKKFELQHLL